MMCESSLEERCRAAILRAGIDGRTSFFGGCLLQTSSIHQIHDFTKLAPEKIEQLLSEFLEERFVDYCERRARGLKYDWIPVNYLLSQGYKRGLQWRGLPLGKTCWDVGIYQQLLQELKPKTLIEFGTGIGASALFFGDHSRMFGVDTKVITLDLNAKDVSPTLFEDQSIEFVAGDVKEVARLLPVERLLKCPHPWLIVEDCHMHLRVIIDHLQPLMVSGDYLVVEDIGVSAAGSREIASALKGLHRGVLMVDTFYTDMFGRNLTCSPDAILRKM